MIDRKEYLRDYYKNHREFYREYQRKWYKEHKLEHDARGKKYAETHKAEMVKNVQKYVQKNREKVRAYNYVYSKSVMGKFRTYRSQAKAKGNEMAINLDEFAKITSSPCIYCGDVEKIGIDRIDNDKGYTIENSSPCCSICNYMKKNHTKEKFLSHITKIFNYKPL